MAKRFFSKDSFWNTPLNTPAPADPESQRLVALLQAIRPAGFWVNCTEYTIPVYEADKNTPRRTVHRRFLPDGSGAMPFKNAVESSKPWIKPGHPMGHGPGFGKDVPIPEHAREDPAGDHHISIVDWDRMLAWDMWAALHRPDGEWESCSGMIYPLNGNGLFDLAQFAHLHNGESVHLYGPCRAPGVPSIAGLIMHGELNEGNIPHKLAFATEVPAHRQFVNPPACWTDGPITAGFPEGAILQLDPSIDLSRFKLTPSGLVIARALQQYGAVCVDGCGGNTVYAEGLYAHPYKRWDGLLDHHAIEPLGYEHFRVVRMERVIHKGDDRHFNRLREQNLPHTAEQILAARENAV